MRKKSTRKIENLTKYMIFKGLNDNKVTVECGLSQGLLRQARSGKADLGLKTIERVLNKYQDLSRQFLITGEGDMIKSSPDKDTIAVEDVQTEELPVIPRNICEATGIDIMEYISDNDVPTSPKVEQFPAADAFYIVYGDEMSPYFLPGDKLAISPYEVGKERKVLDGRTYLIDTLYNGLMLRQLHKIEGGFRAKAINPQYGEEIIEMEEISRIYRILGLLRTNC